MNSGTILKLKVFSKSVKNIALLSNTEITFTASFSEIDW